MTLEVYYFESGKVFKQESWLKRHDTRYEPNGYRYRDMVYIL